MAIEDHSRIAFTQMYPNEKNESAMEFMRATTRYFARLRVPIQLVITDNGPAFHSAAFAEGLPRVAHHAEVHARLSPAYQWQGQALHPVGPAGVVVRTYL